MSGHDRAVMSKRDAILQSATRAFATKGYRETSASDLARMTGSAEGTVFYHFGNKERLFLAVLDQARCELEREISATLDQLEPSSDPDAIERAAKLYLQLASDREELFQLLHRSDAYELARVNEDCRAQLEAIFECFVGLFECALTDGASPATTAHGPARRLALVIYTLIDGLVRTRDCGLYDPGALFPDLMDACRTLIAHADLGSP